MKDQHNPNAKKRPFITAAISYVLLIAISYFCYVSQQSAFDYVSTALLTLTVILLLAFIPIVFKFLRFPQNNDTPQLPAYPHSQRWFILVLNQSLILLGGGLFFFGIVLQSHISPKANSIPFESFMPLLTQKAPYCLFLPWVIISAISILANHRAQKTNSMVWLPTLTIGSAPRHPKKFFLSAYNDILNIVITTAAALLICVAIGILCESWAQAGIIPSAWQTPIRSGFLMFTLLLFSYKRRDQLLKKYVQRHFSLGAIFCIAAFLIVAILFSFEIALNFLEFPIEERTPIPHSTGYMDSTAAIRSLGMALMVWPLFLIPYLVPLFARISLGLRAWQAFLMPLIVPGILFLWLLPQHLQEHEFLNFIHALQAPYPLFFLGLLGLFVVYFLFQHVHSSFDLHIGSMPLINPPYKNIGLYLVSRPLVKGILNWMALLFIGGWFIVHFSLYGISLFFLLCLNISAVRFLVSNFRSTSVCPSLDRGS